MGSCLERNIKRETELQETPMIEAVVGAMVTIIVGTYIFIPWYKKIWYRIIGFCYLRKERKKYEM